MKNFKFLILLLVVVAGISFAAGRNNRAERAKRGKGNSYIIDVQPRRFCGKDGSGHWIPCEGGGEKPMPE
jgi:hypothetical protein